MEKDKTLYTFIGKKFSPIKDGIIKNAKENKRYKLEISLNRDVKFKGERCLVILKNPSKAGLTDVYESDKTVNTVCKYLYDRTDVINAKTLVIMNLFPVYGTESRELFKLKKSALVDRLNMDFLKSQIQLADKIIIAWGKHPIKCKPHYNDMVNFVLPLLSGKDCYQMKHPRFKLNIRNPLHGQVWGFNNYELVKVDIANCINC